MPRSRRYIHCKPYGRRESQTAKRRCLPTAVLGALTFARVSIGSIVVSIVVSIEVCICVFGSRGTWVRYAVLLYSL